MEHGSPDELSVNRENVQERMGPIKDLHAYVRGILDVAHANSKRRYDLRRRPVEYSVGDLVWRCEYRLSDASKFFNAKLGGKFGGPFKVKKKMGLLTCELVDEDGCSKGVWHVKDLKAHTLDE